MLLESENNSGKLQIISGKFQNDSIDDVKQISLSHVINSEALFTYDTKNIHFLDSQNTPFSIW